MEIIKQSPADRLDELARDADRNYPFSKFEGDDLRRIARHVRELESRLAAILSNSVGIA